MIDWKINPALSVEWTRNVLLGSTGLKVSIPCIILYRLNSQFRWEILTPPVYGSSLEPLLWGISSYVFERLTSTGGKLFSFLWGCKICISKCLDSYRRLAKKVLILRLKSEKTTSSWRASRKSVASWTSWSQKHCAWLTRMRYKESCVIIWRKR